ncbi:hypothetical protein SAMN05443550_104389 [Pedobacter hartonius]|uniref:Uncharacterized protein n=1 Tax=Pedobacter hartonius TaxID=425514 RepID=A0A1H4D9X7_9SPHI|nr:hypothetical protein SAMN05443550_104389 [Pedobacter hartonius]
MSRTAITILKKRMLAIFIACLAAGLILRMLHFSNVICIVLFSAATLSLFTLFILVNKEFFQKKAR